MGELISYFLRKQAKKKGLGQGSGLWLFVGAVSVLFRGYKRLATKTETVSFGERLRPGDEIVLRYPGKPSRQTKKEVAVLEKRERIANEKASQTANALAQAELKKQYKRAQKIAAKNARKSVPKK